MAHNIQEAHRSPDHTAFGFKSASESSRVDPSTSPEPVSYTPHTARWGEFMDICDLLDPSTLAGKTLGTDYVLLSHRPKDPTTVPLIHAGGLKSQAKVNADDGIDTDHCYSHFTRDPYLVYFSPVASSEDSRIIAPESIVVAAHPNSVNVFDQGGRTRVSDRDPSYEYNRSLYMASCLGVSDFVRRREALAPGTHLDQFGRPSEASPNTYHPECLVQASIISPDMFVPHDAISPDLLLSGLDSAGSQSDAVQTSTSQTDNAIRQPMGDGIIGYYHGRPIFRESSRARRK